MLAPAFLAVVGALTLCGFLIMLMIFGNRSHAKFLLTEEAVSYQSMDRKARTLSRTAVRASGCWEARPPADAPIVGIDFVNDDIRFNISLLF